MQFVYHEQCSENSLILEGENHKYLFKVRRHKIGDIIAFRNLKDAKLYEYSVESIDRRQAILTLKNAYEKIVESDKKLRIIWSVVDPKTIEKQLSYLNEMGVDKISFYYADYSQKQFKLNFEKYEKILINSSQQCGRSSIMQLELIEDIGSLQNCYMLNFSDKMIDEVDDIQTIIIGCEGGFSNNEVEQFAQDKIVGLKSNLILRSETAITAVATKILL